jgi:hypothetical protein
MVLVRRIRLPDATIFSALIAAVLLGMGAISCFWLVLGALGLLGRGVALAVTAALVVLSLFELRRWRAGASLSLSLPPPTTGLFILSTLGMSLIAALLPPVAFDALVYHLFVPDQWIRNGRLEIWQQFPHAHFPHFVETLFLPAMLLHGDIGATLLHWAFLPVLLWLIWHVTNRFLPSGSPWLAVTLAVATPMVPLLASTPYGDVALAAMEMGTLWALLEWLRSRAPGWIVLAGAFAGMAMAIKYTSFMLPLTVVAILLAAGRREWRSAARTALIFSAVAVLAAGPWYLLTYVQTGNPVYPFAFGGIAWDSGRARHYAAAGTGIGLNPAELIRLPLWTTLGIDDANVWDSEIGPLYLATLPFVWAFWRRRRSLNAPADEWRTASVLAFASLIQIAFWTVGVIASASLRQNRLLLSALMMLVPVIAWALTPFIRPREDSRPAGPRILRVLIGITLVLTLVRQAAMLARTNPLPWLVGSESRQEAYRSFAGSFGAAMDATRHLPSNAKLLFLFEPRGYISYRPAQPDTVLDELEYQLRLYGSAGAVAEHWREAGYSHVLISWRHVDVLLTNQRIRAAGKTDGQIAPIQQLSRNTEEALHRLVRNELDLVWKSADGDYALYGLRPRKGLTE